MSTTNIVTSFADVEAREIRWLWKPYIALGRITLVHGSRNVDIRKFLNEIAARISIGGLTSDSDGKKVLLIDTEKNPALVKAQLEALGGDIENISFIPECDLSTLLSSKNEIVESCIDVLIISIIEDMLYMRKNTKPVEVNNVLIKLRSFASVTGCSIIIGSDCLHQDKDDMSRYVTEPIRRIPGSILSVTHHENVYTIKQEKNRFGIEGSDVELAQR